MGRLTNHKTHLNYPKGDKTNRYLFYNDILYWMFTVFYNLNKWIL